MAVQLVALVEKAINEQAEDIVKQVVATMKEEAPKDSGQMANSISSVKTGQFTWLVSTHASNPINGFEYPARIELGQTVYPTKAKALYFHGGWHKKSNASKKSGFAKRTVARFR